MDGFNVIVTNTFLQLWEFRPYFERMVDFSVFPAHIDIVEMPNYYGSIHGVPPEKIGEMRARMEPGSLILKTLLNEYPGWNITFRRAP